jgi:phage shock protein A
MLDSTLLKKYYIKKRELEIIVRELRKEANELVDRIKELEKYCDTLKIKAEIMSIMRDIKDLLRSIGSQDIKDTLTKIMEKLDTALDKLDQLEPYSLRPQAKPQAREAPRAREPR